MQNKIKSNSINNILFLFNMLINKKLSKKEIIEEFEKKSIQISLSSIDNYINVLKHNGIEILIEKENNKNYYSINKKSSFNQNKIIEYLPILRNMKQKIIALKDFDLIKNSVRLFYKISSVIDDKSLRGQFANFGYYSQINWFLINQLQKHCIKKNIIQIEYFPLNSKSNLIEIHCDCLKIEGSSNRLYLKGFVKRINKYYSLPVDRIFMVKKIIKENIPFNFNDTETIEYTISKEIFLAIGLEENEKIIKEDNKKVTIKRPIIDDFATIQRLLFCCPDLYEINNERIKKILIEKIKKITQTYA